MDLKAAAAAIHTELKQRVLVTQGGVPTFFDNYLHKLFKRLAATEDAHAWDIANLVANGRGATEQAHELRLVQELQRKRERGRFVSYRDRVADDDSYLVTRCGPMTTIMSTGTAAAPTWKGQPLFKTAYDVAIIPMLLWELKPKTILEIGSGSGASAEWMSDVARMLQLEARVYSVDINPIRRTVPGVTFLEGNASTPESLFHRNILRTAPHPWLVLEDAHVNVAGVLTAMAASMTPGDYLIVEDSSVKAADIESFLKAHPDSFKVDTFYTDFYGYNATCAPNSIFRYGG